MLFTEIASTWGRTGYGGDKVEIEFCFGYTKFERP